LKYLLEQIKKTIVFLGNINDKGEILPSATGFLVSINNYIHLVTAKHVIVNPQNEAFIDNTLYAFINTKVGKIGAYSVNILKNQGLRWIFHQNKIVDIAMIPFSVNYPDDDIRFIPNDLFLASDQLYEVYDVFFLSYQPGIKVDTRISPVIRSGTISLINEDNTFLIDAAAFPGNSGSPVFLKPSIFRYNDEGRPSLGGDTLGGKFIGLIGSYLPYHEAAISTQTGRIRVVFEENTGLSYVWSASFIKEIIESKEFKDQLGRINKSYEAT
jgi:hypothetical protein